MSDLQEYSAALRGHKAPPDVMRGGCHSATLSSRLGLVHFKCDPCINLINSTVSNSRADLLRDIDIKLVVHMRVAEVFEVADLWDVYEDMHRQNSVKVEKELFQAILASIREEGPHGWQHDVEHMLHEIVVDLRC